MAVTYVVLAHRAPQQLARLVRRLLPGGHGVVVHLDARVDAAPFEAALSDLTGGAGVSLVEDRVFCRWGDYSLVEATVRGLEAALRLTPSASHLVLLSGQCYPIKPPAHISEVFATHEGRSFMFSSRGETPRHVDRTGNETWYWDGRMSRLGRYHLRLGDLIVAFPNRFTPGLPHRRMPHGLEAMQGSQWFALDVGAARYLVEYLRQRRDVVRFFRHVKAPDENVAQMVLGASPYAGAVIQDDLHYIEWPGYHPKDLGVEDLDALLASPKLFARKIDAGTDAELLDRLDALQAVGA